ncbi:hypothetical protein HHI36_011200, partial [Cryptolaemus montrouzieri]
SLFFPTTTVVQYTYGLSVPITIEGAEGGTTILLSTCFQGNYDLPKTSSDLQVHTLQRRDTSSNDITKYEFYENAIEYLESIGLDGQDCLCRMICEIARYPLDSQNDNNVFERLAHFIFTPSLKSDDNIYNERKNHLYLSLLQAEEAGRKRQHCKSRYSSCVTPLVNLFTKYILI